MGALQLIDEFGLYETVFSPPDAKHQTPRPDTTAWGTVYGCLDTLRRHRTPGSIYDVLVRSEDCAYYAWVLAALSPWELVAGPAHTGPGKPPPPRSTVAAQEGIKSPSKLCGVITGAHEHRGAIVALRDAVCRGADYAGERDRFGMAIRKWDSEGGHWRLQVLAAILVERLQLGRIGEADGGESARRSPDWRAPY